MVLNQITADAKAIKIFIHSFTGTLFGYFQNYIQSVKKRDQKWTIKGTKNWVIDSIAVNILVSGLVDKSSKTYIGLSTLEAVTPSIISRSKI